MNKFIYSFAAGITAALLIAGSASAATTTTNNGNTMRHHHQRMALDQYGCRWQSNTNDYRCYRGAMAGQRYESQQAMMDAMQDNQLRVVQSDMRSGRLVPVYVDDDGAPRPLPPHASRGQELPPVDAGMAEIPVW